MSMESPHWYGLTIGIMAIFMAIPLGASALTVSPERLDIILPPLGTETKNIRLYNETQRPVLVTPEITNLSFEIKQENPLNNWFLYNPDTIKLEPGAWVDFPVKIQISANTASGGYYGALLFKAIDETQAEEGGIGIIGKTGPLLFITVEGTFSTKAEVVEFDEQTKPFFGQRVFDHVPEAFLVSVQNTGDVHVVPQGRISVYNWFGRIRDAMSVNPEARMVLPGWVRTFTAGTKDFMQGFKAEWQRFGFGRYTTTLTLTMGEQGAYEELKYWVIPWRLIGLALIIVYSASSFNRRLRTRREK